MSVNVKEINQCLSRMRKCGRISDIRGKGSFGEQAALSIVLERQRRTGGLVYHSFKYPYQTSREGVVYTGNIYYENGKYTEITKVGLEDEIDILFISKYRVFPIEVKSYKTNKLEVYDHWVKRDNVELDKSPIAQAEKHARHIYHAIYDVLPDGRPEYIVPIVCFVDKCKVIDNRASSSYLPCCVLNSLKKTIIENSTPLKYFIDIKEMKSKLATIKTSVEKEFV